MVNFLLENLCCYSSTDSLGVLESEKVFCGLDFYRTDYWKLFLRGWFLLNLILSFVWSLSSLAYLYGVFLKMFQFHNLKYEVNICNTWRFNRFNCAIGRLNIEYCHVWDFFGSWNQLFPIRLWDLVYGYILSSLQMRNETFLLEMKLFNTRSFLIHCYIID